MKRTLRFALIAAVVVCVIAAALALFVNANQFRPTLESELSRALGREVHIADLRLSILSGGISANGLTVADDPAFSRSPFISAKSLAVSVQLMPLLFSHKVNVTGITIEQPDIVLLQSPNGRWNFSGIGAAKTNAQTPSTTSPEKFSLSVKRLRIADGKLTVGSTTPNARPQVYSAVDIDVRDFSPASASPFSLSAKMAGGGSLNLSGTAGPINSADAAMTPFQATVAVKHLDLIATGFVKPATGFGGLLSLAGNGSSDGRTLHAGGRIVAEQLKLARNGSPARRPVQFDFVTDYDLEKRSGAVRRGDIHIGAAVAHLAGTWKLHGDSTLLDMRVAGQNMPIPDLEGMLPALAIVLPAGSSLQGGTAQANVAVQGSTENLVTSGTVGLNHTRLAGYDLGSRIRTMATMAGIRTSPNTDIESFSANIRVGPEGATVENLRVVATGIGELTGGGSVSPGHALDFKMLMRLQTSGGLMAFVPGQRGQLGVPFFIRGTSSSPAFIPDVRGIAGSEAKSILKSDQVRQGATTLLQNLLGGKKKP